MTPLEILTKAQNLIRDPKDWTQEAIAVDENGNETYTSDKKAACYSSLGALFRTEPEFSVEAFKALTILDEIALRYGFSPSHCDKGACHKVVMKAFDDARELAA